MKKLIILPTIFFLITCLFSQETGLIDSNIKSPNFVLILVDDAALQDFGVYGGEAFTPNIDLLAQQGTMFTNYHSSLMLAGVPNLPVFLAPEHTVHPNYNGILNTRVETVATRLKGNGYNTYIAGKWHLGNTSYTLPTRRDDGIYGGRTQ